MTLSLAFVIGLGGLIVTYNRALNRSKAAQAQALQSNANAAINAALLPPPAQTAAPGDHSAAVEPAAVETASRPRRRRHPPSAAPAAAAPPPSAVSPVAAASDERLPGWIGVTDRMGLRIVVLHWHDDAPGRRKMKELYAADSTIVTVIINNTAGGAHVTIDPASLEFHFLDYTTLKALPPKDVLATARSDADYYVKRYGGEWSVAPQQVRNDGLAFFAPATDLTSARAVTMVLNGQRIVVPGKYCTADEKAEILERLQIGR